MFLITLLVSRTVVSVLCVIAQCRKMAVKRAPDLCEITQTGAQCTAISCFVMLGAGTAVRGSSCSCRLLHPCTTYTNVRTGIMQHLSSEDVPLRIRSNLALQS